MSDISELLDRFRRGPELLATAMTGAAGSELDFVPEPGKWSLRQIVAHVSDSEIVGADRFRRLIAEENPTLQAYDQVAWSNNLNYARRRTSESLETFRRIRSENFDLLNELPEASFDRAGTHTERGRITLRDCLQTYAEHAEAHARQIQQVRQLYKQQKKRASEAG